MRSTGRGPSCATADVPAVTHRGLPVPVSGRRDRQVNEVTTERISGFLAAIAARDQDPRAEGPDDRQVQDPPVLVRPGPD